MKESELLDKVNRLERENASLKANLEDCNVYRHLFNNSKDLVCIADMGCNFKMVNPSFSELLGYSTEELTSRPYMDFIHSDDKEKTSREVEINRIGKATPKFENRYIKKNGEIVTLQWMRSIDKKNELIFAIARDITTQKEIEDKLKRQEELFNASQKVAKLGNFSYNTLDYSLYWSDELYNIFGISEEEKSTLYDAYVSRFDKEGFENYSKLVEESLNSGEKYAFKHKVYIPGGKVKTVSCYGIPFKDENGKVYRIDGVVQDITEEVESQKTILKTVAEKEFLMQELHHRVKNNLQIISSLLNLQTELISDKEGRQQLVESRNRILSIAAVHDMLYNSGNMTTISFCEYVKSLMEDLVGSHSSNDKKPMIWFDLDRIHLSLDIAVPLGLIINELVTNSLKYAFDSISNPELKVSLKNTGNSLKLEISDNGKGFNIEEVDSSKSLGLLVVDSLSEQLGGEYLLESTKEGTHYHISDVVI